MTRAPLDLSPCHVTARALAVLGRIRRAVPPAPWFAYELGRAPVSPRVWFGFSTTYRLTDSAATEHLR